MKCLRCLFLLVFINSTKCDNPLTANDGCPGDKEIGIAYDLSTKLNSTEFKRQQDFLLNYLFQNWTSFEKLNLIAYGIDIYNTYGFANRTELNDFIVSTEQCETDKINFCGVIGDISPNSFADNGDPYYSAIIIFVSQDYFQINSFFCVVYFQSFNQHTQSILFVIMKRDVRADYFRKTFPKAQIVYWDIDREEVPTNWKWTFNTAYGCNENNDYLPNEYPCRSRILIGMDASVNVNPNDFKKQQDFLINNIFTNNWTNIENLAVVKYSNRTETVKEFGNIVDLKQLNNLINQTKQMEERLELCKVFRDLTSMYLQSTNIILFVSKFSGIDRSWCEFPAQVIRTNANSILFVTLSNQVDVDYLQYLFPYANFLNTTTNWRPVFESSYGCNKYSSFKQSYPCEDRAFLIAFDNLNVLTPFAYKKQVDFLLTNIFIESWSNFNLMLLNYNSHKNNVDVYNVRDVYFVVNVKTYIRNTLMADNPTGICDAINYASSTMDLLNANLIFFISEFGTEMDECYGKLDTTNYVNAKNITFIVLTLKVNQSALLASFPKANIIQWDIENETAVYPPNWEQNVWSAFGCAGRSPLLPQPTLPPKATTLSTTTTTGVIYTTKSTTTTKSTMTSQLLQTTTHSTFETTSNPPNNLKAILLGTLVPLFVITLILIVVCFCLYKRRKRGQFINNLAFRGQNESNDSDERKRIDDLWKIERENVEIFIETMLGSGAFANVYLGKINGNSGIKRVYPDLVAVSHYQDCETAVKILPAYATQEDREDFKQEINFMKFLKYHSHIVCLLGYNDGQIFLEYCANGDLLRFLKQNKNQFNTEGGLNTRDLMSFGWQIANGMDYFSSLNLIHRDLAARNVLLDKDNVCKIGDFGLCRLAENYVSRGGLLPIRWMPPEALKSFDYGMKTDIWSYGILLFELFSIGKLPYSGKENAQILRYLEDGNRLEQPEYAPDEIYTLMLTCWRAVSDERPTFSKLCQDLIPILETFNLHYNYVNPSETETNVPSIFEIESEEVAV